MPNQVSDFRLYTHTCQLGFRVRLPEWQFHAESAVGRWARERLRCGTWDAWVRDLRTCLPTVPPDSLGRHLIQFLDGGAERRSERSVSAPNA